MSHRLDLGAAQAGIRRAIGIVGRGANWLSEFIPLKGFHSLSTSIVEARTYLNDSVIVFGMEVPP